MHPGSGDNSVVECQTHDRKVVGSSPYRSGRKTFFSRVSFLFGIHSIPMLLPGHSAKSAGGRLQVNTQAPYMASNEVTVNCAWLYGVHRRCTKMAAVSCGTSHVTTSAWLYGVYRTCAKMIAVSCGTSHATTSAWLYGVHRTCARMAAVSYGTSHVTTGEWLYGVHRTCTKMAAVSCGTSHVTTKQCCKNITWVGHNKNISNHAV